MAFALAPCCLGSGSSMAARTALSMPTRTVAASPIAILSPRPAAMQRSRLSTASLPSLRATSHPAFTSSSFLLTFKHASFPLATCSTVRLSVLARQNSSVAATSNSSTGPAAPIPKGSPSSLTWNEFLALRTRRRRINVIFSVVCGLSTMAVGAGYIASQDLEKLNSFSFGLDPMIVLGAATMACGMVGWLLGPFLGGAVFGVIYRRVGGAMRAKEREFFNRIKRNRSDPSGQSMNNPVPDYYGEKISSVQGYRRWLKDQRAFRKKREADVI